MEAASSGVIVSSVSGQTRRAGALRRLAKQRGSPQSTRSPTLKSVTSLPTAEMTPAASRPKFWP